MIDTPGRHDAVPFRRLVWVVDVRAGALRPPMLSVSASRGVVRRSLLTSNEARADDLSFYKVCQAGDLVVNRMSAYQGALGLSMEEGLVSPDYLVLRPMPGVEPSYLHHLCRSTWFVGEMSARLRGIGSIGLGTVRTPRINYEDLGSICVPLVPQSQQRRIADFLDDQVGLLDRAITLRQQQKELLDERFGVEVSERLAALGGMPCRLKHFCVGPGQYGYNIPASEYVPRADGAVRMLRTTDLRGGSLITAEDGVFVPHLPDDRLTLRSGDMLASRAGTVGKAFLVPDEAAGMTFAGFLVRFRGWTGVDMRFVMYQMQDRQVQAEIQRNAIVSTIQNFNAERYGELPMRKVPLAQQRVLANDLDARAERIEQSKALLDDSLGLFAERKQALITAAVTGQFDVTTAMKVAV